MTIKQAAMWLCQPGIVSMIHDPTTKKALSVAVKALAESELSTNLASLGTDCISRQAAINAIDECYCGGEDSCGEPWIYKENAVEAIQMIERLPSAQPEIIRCRECKFASGDSRICMKFGRSPIGELDFCAWAERRTDG